MVAKKLKIWIILFACVVFSAVHLDNTDRKSLIPVNKLRLAQKLRENIKNRFQKKYIGSLLKRARKKKVKKLKVGDVVLVEVENRKRLTWPVARILEVYTGADGNERVAKIKVSGGGELVRPFQRLYHLELDDEEDRRELAARFC